MFKTVFISILLAAAMIIAAFLLHDARPQVEVNQPTAALVAATGLRIVAS